ncbi:MAG TPA: hypothetical protein VLB50_14340 [Ignavibacteriaceae bacterium]|nr:hypothetical protein [Ignavibacteriaceae bacterium]
MAILKNSIVLQNATGSLGEFFIKNFRGKKILAKKSFNRKISRSAAAVNGRSNFAASVLISKTINKQPVLKEIWKVANIEASSPYQKMMAYNSKRTDNGTLTTSNGITPGGIPLTINSVSVQNYILDLSFNLPTENYITFPAQVFVFLYFKNSREPMFALNNKITEASPDANYTMNFQLDDEMRKAFKKDVNPLIYVAAAGSTLHKKKEYWSETAAFQL